MRGLDPTDLREQLDGAGLRDVLDLFGLGEMAASIQGKGSGKPSARHKPSAFERHFNTFYLAMRNAHTPQQILANAGPLYEHLLEPAQHAGRLNKLDTYDLKLLYRGTLTMASVSPDARFLAYMRMDIDEFARRGLAIDSPVNELRDLLVTFWLHN